MVRTCCVAKWPVVLAVPRWFERMVDCFAGSSVDDRWTTGLAARDVDDLYVAHGVGACINMSVSNVLCSFERLIEADKVREWHDEVLLTIGTEVCGRNDRSCSAGVLLFRW